MTGRIPDQSVPLFAFFVGRGRSGTTLLRAMFDSHSQMAIPPESHFIPRMTKLGYEASGRLDRDRLVRGLFGRSEFRGWGLAEDEVRAAIDASPPTLADALRAVYALYADRQGKSRYGDKTPNYVFHLPLLVELLPESRFVHVIRDGRDVSLSRKDADFKPSSLEGSAIYWKRFVERGRRDGRILGPSRYREVRYEDVLRDPEKEVRALCLFLELDFEPSMLEFYQRAESLVGAQPHHKNIYRPVTGPPRDWRTELSRRDVEVFELLAGDLLEELGYERGSDRIALATRLTTRVRQLRFELSRKGRGIRKLAKRNRRRIQRSFEGVS